MKYKHSMFHAYSIAILGAYQSYTNFRRTRFISLYCEKHIFSNTASVLANYSFSINPNDQIFVQATYKNIYIYIQLGSPFSAGVLESTIASWKCSPGF